MLSSSQVIEKNVNVLVLALLTGAACAVSGLSPSEEKIYEAWQKLDSDMAGLKIRYADDALIEFGAAGKVNIGSFDELVGSFEPAIERFVTLWEPVATVQGSGAFSFKYYDYVKFNNNCDTLCSGTATIKFNENGLVSEHKVYSDDSDEFIACADKFFVEMKKEEEL